MTPYPLYDPKMEHESCGVGAVVDLGGKPSHRTVSDALTIVERLAHRAGHDALGTTGDGVGVMTQLPHALFTEWAAAQHLSLGAPGEYGVGMFFLPEDPIAAQMAREIFARLTAAEGMKLIGWRDVPCHPEILGAGARRSMPTIRQCFIAKPGNVPCGLAFDRKLYILRRQFEHQQTETYVCSLSSRTIVYKGMMLVHQLRTFYDDLQNGQYQSCMAMVHSRFSTNTTPSWEKAHPHRMLLHNGEINTIRGNEDRMYAREESMRSPVMEQNIQKVFPVVTADGSDSQMLDNTLEFLCMNELPLPLCGMVLLPEPWQGQRVETPWRDFYRYWSILMEPWDGPAAVLYSDGEKVCASLDRNGLRPMRCALTQDRRLILSSEAGVLHEEKDHTIRRWRLKAGSLLVADLSSGELLEGDAIKMQYAAEHPYSQWLQNMVHLNDLPAAPSVSKPLDEIERIQLCKAFGYSKEDIQDILLPMAQNGSEPIVSMGADEPIAALSKAHPPLFDYFKQRFAQVTNPPIDALRESIKTDCSIYLGDDGNLLMPSPGNCKVIELDSPVLTIEELEKIRQMRGRDFQVATLSLLFSPESSLKNAVDELCTACDRAVSTGANIVILSDRGVDRTHMAIPSLLAVSALEQHLVREKKRTAVSVLLESGEPRDVHQLAALIAFGARAVCPYLAHECIKSLCEKEASIQKYHQALTAGVQKIASKMGVSTLQAYQSAQLFEALGLDVPLVENYFTNTPHQLGGIGLEHIEADLRWHHQRAYQSTSDPMLDSVGVHRLRKSETAEEHLYTPQVIHTLQQAVWTNSEELFDKYAEMIESDGPRAIRSLLDFRFECCTPVPLEEVEPVEQIVRRFKTGAMSYGSISREAHECMAIAMNRLGGRSNSGEGGEWPERFGTELNSAVKQVASARFGVTREYLQSAKEIQIKMAQGAKPGEGGHLPGKKVTGDVARTRCSTEGISLISPPPHHDIYSIEDLAQLIYDLQCANEKADVTVKLVSSTGVGIIASGVAKAGAHGILISGGEGGTGAAPLSSVHHAGLPWEIGLAEAHQVLCKNGLRQCVKLEADGKLMSGRDVAVALLLGAEEFGFATAPLITMGCRMMRVCHLGTCPFGIATQNPELRKRFTGKPEYIERFMRFTAGQLRVIMAKLGARTVNELVGRADLLKVKPGTKLELSSLIGRGINVCCRADASFHFALEERPDKQLTGDNAEVLTTHRAFGTTLTGCRSVHASGCAGQSFGAFLPRGQQIILHGECNDYLGKGLSGGILAVAPPENAVWHETDSLIGNVALYGATSGEAYIAGMAGERFCVRNSGATAVVEGVGDHGCEYMTGGRVVVLGSIGDNFAAGMSGGIAYVLDEQGMADQYINHGMVEVEAVCGCYADELRRILEKHVLKTQSPKAKSILRHFDAALRCFHMVIPTEYKRRLEQA